MVNIDNAMIERAAKMAEAISEIEANIAISDLRPITLRDLYQKLQAQDENYLDVPLFLFVNIFRPGTT